MNADKETILKLVAEYMSKRHAEKKWTAGQDWVQYSGPYFNSDEFVASIGTLLEEWLTLGDKAIQFEKKFAPLLGKKHGVVVNSGSSANLIMMATAKRYYGWKNGDRVIVPVAGFPTTLNPIIQCGLLPVFVDIELDTLNLNLEQVEKACKNGAVAITFAHVLGNPPNMDKLTQLMVKYSIPLLEDCCDALGSTHDGELAGSNGVMATCSFYPAHHITMGEGGFVACANEEIEMIARSFREWGRGCYCVGRKANLSTKGSCGCRFSKWLPTLPDEVFDHKYVYDNIGYNLKPIELQCAMGLAQIEKLPEIHQKRKDNHKRLVEIFAPYEKYFIVHKATPTSDPSWFAFPATVKNDAPFKRSKFTSFLEENKVQTRNYFGGNLLLQPAYKDLKCTTWLGGTISDARLLFPVATKVTTDTFFLGTSPIITPEQMDYVEVIVNKFFKTI